MTGQNILSAKEVVERYPALNLGTLANWRNQKRGPRYFKVSRKVVYRPSDVEAFLFRNPGLTADCID